ncbi:MAG TPA: CCA tRNA nucleotidyltransferase, partial [Xanthobacteraceae bacterium]|nr:CCA tRNA nucleotidyltransferase [Xanthobacteraceae bacterium]
YLRILRFFRFHAYFADGPLDPMGLLASIRARAGLDTLSRERVRLELLKLLVAPRGAATLAAMADGGILGPVLGGVPYIADFARMAEIETALAVDPDAIRRLGALAVMVDEDAERLSERLRLANAESARLMALESWWRVSPAAGEQRAHALLYRLGLQSFTDRVLLAWARSGVGATDDAWRALAALPRRWTTPEFPIKAADFIRRGVAVGPMLGAAMRAAKEAWIAADFPADRLSIEALAERALQDATASG